MTLIGDIVLQTWMSARYPACVLRSVRTRKAVISAVVMKVMSGKLLTIDVEPLVISPCFLFTYLVVIDQTPFL